MFFGVISIILQGFSQTPTLPQQILQSTLEVDPIANTQINSDFVLGCDSPNMEGYYCHGDYLDLKYGFPFTNPRTADHSPGAYDYNMLIFDGFLTDGHTIWEQEDYVFDNLVKYSFNFWAHNRFFSDPVNEVEIDLFIGGVFQQTFIVKAKNGWQEFNFTIPFFSNFGTADITLVQKYGGAAKDFALDDITMSWQPYNMDPQTLFMDSLNLMNPHIQRDPIEEAYYIAGSAVYNATSSKLYVIKVDRFGQPIWSNTYNIGQNGDARCYGFTYNPNRNSYLLTGYYLNDQEWRTPYILEINLNGSIKSQHSISVAENKNCIALDIIVDGKGNIVLGGFTDATPMPDLGTYPATINGMVVKLDANFNVNWIHEISTSQQSCSYNFDEYIAVNSLTETPSGYFLTGSISEIGPGRNTTQGVLNRTINMNGQLVWDRSYHHVQSCSTTAHSFCGSDALMFKGELISTNNSSNWHSLGYNKQIPANGGYIFSGVGNSGLGHNWSNQILPAINGKDVIIAGINSDNDIPVVRSLNPVSGNVNWSMEYMVQNDPAYYHTFGQNDKRLQPFGSGGYFQTFEYSDLMVIEPNAGFYTPNGSYMLVANRCDGPGKLIGLEFFELTEQGGKSINSTDCAVNELTESYGQVPMEPRFVNGGIEQGHADGLDAAYTDKATQYGGCMNAAPNIPGPGKRALGVGDMMVNANLEVYPNPVNNHLTVRWDASNTVEKVEILNLTGQVLILSPVKSNQGSITISMESLPSSVYLVQVTDSNGEIQTQRVIKQ